MFKTLVVYLLDRYEKRFARKVASNAKTAVLTVVMPVKFNVSVESSGEVAVRVPHLSTGTDAVDRRRWRFVSARQVRAASREFTGAALRMPGA